MRWLTAAGLRVENRLGDLLRRRSSPPPLSAAMQYCALGGGKRLRPAMLLAVAEPSSASACENASADDSEESKLSDSQNFFNNAAAVDAACALECLHCYSLAHDDLPCMDDAETRRGKPSCHKKHGEALALLAGDCLQSVAFEIAADCAPPGAALELAKAAGDGGMGGGQALDLQAAADSESALQTMHRMKTGALFYAAAQIGLLCRDDSSLSDSNADSDSPSQKHRAPSNAPSKVFQNDSKQLGDFASAFGRLFQIANDLKDAAADAALGKTTYATLLGEDRARQCGRQAGDEAMQILNGGHPLLAAMTRHVGRALA